MCRIRYIVRHNALENIYKLLGTRVLAYRVVSTTLLSLWLQDC